MPITALPPPPTRDDPANFAQRGDAFLAALPAFATEANALQTDVNAKQVTASTAAATATEKATSATNSEAAALAHKNAAAGSAEAALASKTAAEAALDAFDDRYLGAKSVAPTLDNDGAALITGALYWDIVLNGGCLRVWQGAWITIPANVASAVATTPAGNLAATDVQAALNELDSEKVATSITLADSVNLNTVVVSGFYRLSNTPANSPGVFVSYGQLVVSRGIDTITQTITHYNNNKMYVRSGNGSDVGGAGAWTPWSEVYNQGTILGTVSQSAGVPTGAVIENGSNANGTYTKFADGTMICNVVVINYVANTAKAATLPATFISSNGCAVSNTPSDNYDYTMMVWAGLTTVTLISQSTRNQSVGITVFGRWF